MKRTKTLLLIVFIASCGLFYACNGDDLLLFSLQDDIELGEQVAERIANDPEQFPILDRTEKPAYESAYQYLESMMNEILASDDVEYQEEFPWKINIIDDDQTLNAFATPGGQIYVYTGLIFFLDRQDDLAGVIGHEIAHSDLRHSSKQLQRQYGIAILLSIVAGESSSQLTQLAGQIAGTLKGLEFSRQAEAEADDFSVRYLNDTQYACNGAAAFFEKLLTNEAQRQPEFLSTHPSPDSRVEDINSLASSIGCSTAESDPSGESWDAFRDNLRQ